MEKNFNELNNNVKTKNSELINKLTGGKIEEVIPVKIKEDLIKDKIYLNNCSQNLLDVKEKLTNELSTKMNELKTLTAKYGDLTTEITTKVNNTFTNHKTDHSTIVKAVEDLISNKSKFIDDFNLQELLSKFNDYIMNLNYEQSLAFVNLSGIFIIMITLISIISIFYGNKILNYFNLESRYPKFAKFILLRLKFQQYYLFVNIIIITIISIIMFALNLTVFI
jgi:hypothetical protein